MRSDLIPATVAVGSGSRVSGSLTSSSAQKTPVPRTSPMTGASPRVGEPGSDEVAPDALRVLDRALLGHGLLRRDDAGRGERVAGVGEPAREDAVVEGVRDLGGDDHAADGDVAGVDALGEGDQVGADVVRVEGEPLARTPEAGHDLVEDQLDAVAVADRAHAGQVAGRGDHDPGRAGHGLEQDRGDRLGALGLDGPLEVVQRAGALLLGRARPRTPSGRGTGRRSARGRWRTRWGCGASRRSRRSPHRCCRGTSGSARGPCPGR